MGTSEGRPQEGSSRHVLTVPNVISFLRIALIPVFFLLIVDPDTTTAGVVLFGIVIATDWVDGTIATTDRTGHGARQGAGSRGGPPGHRSRHHRAGDPRRVPLVGGGRDPREGRRRAPGRLLRAVRAPTSDWTCAGSARSPPSRSWSRCRRSRGRARSTPERRRTTIGWAASRWVSSSTTSRRSRTRRTPVSASDRVMRSASSVSLSASRCGA